MAPSGPFLDPSLHSRQPRGIQPPQEHPRTAQRGRDAPRGSRRGSEPPAAGTGEIPVPGKPRFPGRLRVSPDHPRAGNPRWMNARRGDRGCPGREAFPIWVSRSGEGWTGRSAPSTGRGTRGGTAPAAAGQGREAASAAARGHKLPSRFPNGTLIYLLPLSGLIEFIPLGDSCRGNGFQGKWDLERLQQIPAFIGLGAAMLSEPGDSPGQRPPAHPSLPGRGSGFSRGCQEGPEGEIGLGVTP